MIFFIFIILYGVLDLCHYSIKIKTLEFLIQLHFNNSQINEDIDLDYYANNFAIIKRVETSTSGLFYDYIRFLGCIRNYMIQGFIPIIKLEPDKSLINGILANSSKGNPWENYFNQPFGYKYSIVKKKARFIKYFECKPKKKQMPNYSIFLNNNSINYWHSIAEKYIHIKNELIKESNNIINQLFEGKKDILGVLLSRTDYMSKKAYAQKIKDIIKDIKLFDDKYEYDGIFLSTDDNFIRKELKNSIGEKIKFLLNEKKISNYSSKQFLSYTIDLKKNENYNKIYLLNIIILSKCLDFLGVKTSETIGVFILAKGFRNFKVYKI